MRKLLGAAAAVCAALLIAAPASAGDAEEDQAIADDVVAAVAGLVPDGWVEDPEAGDVDNEGGPPECEDQQATVDEAKEGAYAAAAYQDPADEIGLTEAGAQVFVFPKAKQAKRFVRTLTSDAGAACAEAGAALIDPDASIEELELNSASGFEVVAQSNDFVFVIDQLQTREGRAVALISGVSPDAPLPFIEDFVIGIEEALAEAV
ncbi:MAG: hypothetical protein ACT4PI_07095 [Actinomycetota bacterium]